METFFSTHYHSGEQIHVGDRVSLAGAPGHVVFILGQTPPEQWHSLQEWLCQEHGQGFMLDVQGYGFLFKEESDEDLDFVGRKQE